jgi:ABC-type glutathione transport system ATPase component
MAKKSQQLAVDTRPWRDPSNNKPFVRIKNVTKKFGDVLAVHDVSLDIYKSESLTSIACDRRLSIVAAVVFFSDFFSV